ncbi:MAG: response regulator [Campylobacterota bacterium]|nr:response regulator [Campylobacterota bacterium]
MNRLKIIIVEDELIAAEFLKEILEETGAEVIDIIDTGKEAIEICNKKKPDVIFMDVMLSDRISGCEAAVEIYQQTPESKIIFLTAYIDEEMIDYAAQSNAVSYLTKPYNKEQIIATLKLVTTRRDSIKKPLPKKADKIYLKNGYIYQTQQNRLLKNNKEVELGPTGLKLIELLSTQPDISISNVQISMYIWGKEVNDKTLRSLMFRIRTATDAELVKNVSGTGYMIQSAQNK